MWSGSNKVWLHYQRNIIAADVYAAVFISAFIRHAATQQLQTYHLEILDLQKYKRINKPHKVHLAMKDRAHEPFIFIVGKN